MTDRRRIPELWSRSGGPGAERMVGRLPLGALLGLVVGLLLLGGSFLPDLRSHGTQLGGVPDRPYDALAVVALALECLPLAFGRRWPAASLVLVSLGLAVDQLRGYHSLAGSAMPVALVFAGCYLEGRRRTVVLLLSAAYVPLALALSRLGSGEAASGFVLFYLALALPWGVGAWLRSHRRLEAERQRRVAEDTRAAERTRIARELHDVVTHHVTAMVVQAEAARYLTAAPERLDQTLTAVTDTGRRAITDLRTLLDLLNPDHSTQPAGTPSADGLHTLVEQTRRAGQPVEFAEEGAPAAATGSADLVAYRVVQEALTNALKYAHGSRTSVQVRHGNREIAVEVGTEASAIRAAFPAGSGRGLAGIRERVEILGGDFSAGRRPDGGFAVQARIPAGGGPS